jgi:hypothetical protein
MLSCLTLPDCGARSVDGHAMESGENHNFKSLAVATLHGHRCHTVAFAASQKPSVATNLLLQDT